MVSRSDRSHIFRERKPLRTNTGLGNLKVRWHTCMRGASDRYTYIIPISLPCVQKSMSRLGQGTPSTPSNRLAGASAAERAGRPGVELSTRKKKCPSTHPECRRWAEVVTIMSRLIVIERNGKQRKYRRVVKSREDEYVLRKLGASGKGHKPASRKAKHKPSPKL